MSKAKIVFVVGLPGSGKSFYIGKHYKHLPSSQRPEDFMKYAMNNELKFTKSRHYQDLCRVLKGNGTFVISDIWLCKECFRNEAIEAIGKIRPLKEIAIFWKCFENNPEQCKRNIEKCSKDGSRRNTGNRIRMIEKLHKEYRPDSIRGHVELIQIAGDPPL
jgi:ribosomal protein S14